MLLSQLFIFGQSFGLGYYALIYQSTEGVYSLNNSEIFFQRSIFQVLHVWVWSGNTFPVTVQMQVFRKQPKRIFRMESTLSLAVTIKTGVKVRMHVLSTTSKLLAEKFKEDGEDQLR